MGKLVHVRPCPCGSGRAARDCCGRFKRLSPDAIARAFLQRQARAARELIAPFSPGGLAGLRRELLALPQAHPELARVLTGSATPQVTRLAAAAARRSADDAERFVAAAASRVDSVLIRVTVAKAVIALRADGVIDEYLAAAALLDLEDSRGHLATAAIVGAVALILQDTPRSVPRRSRRQDPAHV